ncbi:MAG: hypothetical protein P8129_07015 [Anaerolineae bacterium]
MTQMQEPTLGALFESAILIERLAGSIYRDLADCFAHHPQSLALWLSLAADEEVHARVLAHVREGASPDRLASPAPRETWAAITEIQQRLEQDPAVSVTNLQQAYELAHEFEHSEVNAIFEFLTVDVVPGAIEGEFVRTHIARHQQKLADFRETYQGENWQQVLAG